jgi:hypothetical protein
MQAVNILNKPRGVEIAATSCAARSYEQFAADGKKLRVNEWRGSVG